MDTEDPKEAWLRSVSLIPIQPRGKKPLLDTWKEFQDRRATPEEWAVWSKKWTRPNVALVCGRVSGIVALDFDGEAGKKLLEEHGYLGDVSSGPPRNVTPNGVHLLFKYPENGLAARLKNAVRLVEGLDVRTDAGYVLIPPSTHPSGQPYRWARPPWCSPLPDLPEWFIRLLGRPERHPPEPQEPRDGLPPGVGQGGRNAEAARLAGSYFRKGLTEPEVLVLCEVWNRANAPPLPAGELSAVVRSISQREAKARPAPEILSGATLAGMDTAPPPMLVEPFFPAGGKAILCGEGGFGKSTLALNLALALCHGVPLFGRFRTAPTAVLYMDSENTLDLVRRRLNKIASGLNVGKDGIYFHFPTKKMDLSDSKSRDNLAESIQRHGCGLVVLDSFLCYATLRNENDNTEVRGFLELVADVGRETGAAMLFIDHAAKPSPDRGGGPPLPRGAGAKRDWADLVLSFEERKHENKTLRTLSFPKTRFCPKMGPLLLEMGGDLVYRATEEETLCTVAAVAAAVADEPGISFGALVERLVDGTGARERTVKYAVNRARESGEVQTSKAGKTVRYFPNGCKEPFAPMEAKSGYESPIFLPSKDLR